MSFFPQQNKFLFVGVPTFSYNIARVSVEAENLLRAQPPTSVLHLILFQIKRTEEKSCYSILLLLKVFKSQLVGFEFQREEAKPAVMHRASEVIPVIRVLNQNMFNTLL